MSETSGRLLRLLSLLQARRDFAGRELAERLGVSRRTIRRDVERLRDLGYPVHATRGASGYRLGAGTALPPLLLDDDEAVAVTVGLRTSAENSVAGIEESALGALAKLEQVLPSRLRHRVATLHAATMRVRDAPGPQVGAETLMIVADSCHRRARLRFDYVGPQGTATVRTVEPHNLVSFGRRWYLVAFDVDRDDWRAFRVDRMTPRAPLGASFVRRTPPNGDAAAYLAHRLSARTWPAQATFRLHRAAEKVADRVWPGMGVVEAVDERGCLFHIGGETVEDLVWMVTSVRVDFTLVAGPAELAEALREQGRRCLRAVESG
ncbi:biotin operon repressor BirA-like protein [Actinoalloteichus hoggarensis]|uniref:Bifunctional biotin--[acetyl-CoA-carboxylase] synthetase/biotin operon repressor n=1 Tax=Actinoalloteichus hoggarensis TaxID=1470176 RepID=A0A221W996_9PSEU|nr:YafY family protein [Actinoalloteichus hoggarensis]ASO22079.1 bifunctional biotin--[acetyl-CoA-carboxylase] synthetase/biotin operon repressor [Actinoalloteichus hoggarensis]MBB5923839.1 biotin operon repressor BirA-like protein [Actinoalloteichus hoggarensis]